MLAADEQPVGEKGLLELKDAKNVALVMVTATVPAAGARQGDVLECTVSSIGSAKSLDKGVLLTTPLLGPQVGRPARLRLCSRPDSTRRREDQDHGKDQPRLPAGGRVSITDS